MPTVACEAHRPADMRSGGVQGGKVFRRVPGTASGEDLRQLWRGREPVEVPRVVDYPSPGNHAVMFLQRAKQRGGRRDDQIGRAQPGTDLPPVLAVFCRSRFGVHRRPP